MKKVTLLLLFVFTLALAGCANKDAEVQSFITEFDAVTKEMTDKINANPTSAGIEEAQKSFDAKKDSLKTKFDSFKNARQAQLSADMLKKFTDSINGNTKLLSDTMTKNAMKLAQDKDAMPKLQKLMQDYSNTFKM